MRGLATGRIAWLAVACSDGGSSGGVTPVDGPARVADGSIATPDGGRADGPDAAPPPDRAPTPDLPPDVTPDRPPYRCPEDDTGLHLVINELDYDNPGGDVAEFIELFNPTCDEVALDDLALSFVNFTYQTGTVEYRRTSLLGAGALASGGYFLAGNIAGVDLVLEGLEGGPNNTIHNAGEPGDGGIAPAAVVLVRPPRDGGGEDEVVDFVSYEGSVPGYDERGIPFGDLETEAGTVLRTDNSTPYSQQRIPNATDTDDNEADFMLIAPTPGRENGF